MEEYIAGLIEEWKAADEEEKAAKERKDALSKEIANSGVETKPFGVAITRRNNGYKDELVDILKAKELRNAYQTVEKPITNVVDTLVQSGVLDAKAIAPFKKEDSVFLRRLDKSG